MQNTQYGNEKQSNREFVFQVFKKEIRKNRAATILSFPAEQGLKGLTSKANPSFEGLCKGHFQNVSFIGLEANRGYFKKLQRMFKKLPKCIEMICSTDHRFFNRLTIPLDGAWLDYFGGTDAKNLDTLKRALKNGVFSDNSVLAVTICDTPRTINCRSVKLLYSHSKNDTLENGHFNWFKKHAKKNGYKVEFIDCFEYRNTDVSSKANKMKTIAYKITKA